MSQTNDDKRPDSFEEFEDLVKRESSLPKNLSKLSHKCAQVGQLNWLDWTLFRQNPTPTIFQNLLWRFSKSYRAVEAQPQAPSTRPANIFEPRRVIAEHSDHLKNSVRRKKNSTDFRDIQSRHFQTNLSTAEADLRQQESSVDSLHDEWHKSILLCWCYQDVVDDARRSLRDAWRD